MNRRQIPTSVNFAVLDGAEPATCAPFSGASFERLAEDSRQFAKRVVASRYAQRYPHDLNLMLYDFNTLMESGGLGTLSGLVVDASEAKKGPYGIALMEQRVEEILLEVFADGAGRAAIAAHLQRDFHLWIACEEHDLSNVEQHLRPAMVRTAQLQLKKIRLVDRVIYNDMLFRFEVYNLLSGLPYSLVKESA